MIEKVTPWERRNLGVESSIEFIIEQGDKWENVNRLINEHRENYQVIHVPCGNTEVLLGAQEIGFKMIEMNIQLTKVLEEVYLPRMYKRFDKAISCHEATDEELETILSYIKKGNVFDSDKVARDPLFGLEQSGFRYYQWTKDVISNGAKMLCMTYKDKDIGFDVLLAKSEDTVEAFLGGLNPNSRDSGLGFSLIYLISRYAKEMGFKKIITGVSSNNMRMLKLHELFGYTVSSGTYCLIKHE